MLKLHVIRPAFGLRAASNFSVKAMALLNMSGLAYETVVMTPNKGPRGKLPVLIDGDQTIPDSSHIQSHLESRYQINFDHGLTARDKADAEAYRKLAEEHLYWAALYVRYFVHPDVTRDGIFDTVPKPMRSLVFGIIKRMVKKSLHGHGLGRHSAEEITVLGEKDVKAFETRIGYGPFFFGKTPSSIDAAVFPMLQSIALPKMDGPLRRAVTESASLISYIKTCDEAFFGLSPIQAKRVT
jgi:glutathione S-transferase